MEREEKVVLKQRERDDRTKELGVRNKVAGEARAQADAVDKAKQKAQKVGPARYCSPRHRHAF